MARQRMSKPVALYHNHAEEDAAERDAAKSGEARKHHDDAWSRHFTAANIHRQAELLRALAHNYRSDAGWHDRQPPQKREYHEHPDTGEMIPMGTYLRLVADEHEASADFAEKKAQEHHEQGVHFSKKGREADAHHHHREAEVFEEHL